MRRIVVVVVSLVLLRCTYLIPLTAEPTRAVDARLVGTWTIDDDKMDIRVYDDRNYVLTYNGDLYRAYHSDVAGLQLISVQNLNDSERKWLFIEWKLSEDGKKLTLRAVRDEIVPDSTRDRDALIKLIEANRDNPKLFGDPGVHTRVR